MAEKNLQSDICNPISATQKILPHPHTPTLPHKTPTRTQRITAEDPSTMPDRAYLTWPFFDDDHRDLAQRVKAWAADHLAEEHEEDAYAATRALVHSLGQGDGCATACPRRTAACTNASTCARSA